MTGPDIELTSDERSIFDRIEFDQSRITYETVRSNGRLIEQLFDALTTRSAIPRQRLLWFTDAQFNPGGRGASRKDQWARNGTTGRDVLGHPNFLSIMRYFMCGADLPVAVVKSFHSAVERCGPVTSGDVSVLSKQARQLTRQHGLQPHQATEEFYKLALDLKLGSYATFIRDSVRSVR